MWYVHKESRNIRNWFRYETFITLLSLRFFDMRRERHNFFNKRAAHFVDPNWSGLENRLHSSRLESQLFRSEFKSQQFFFFQIPKSSALPSMTSFTSPVPFTIWGFYCDISDCHICPACTRVNTCTQCVHLTNPCTKRKVLSQTKPKGKIYETKNDNITKNPSAIILQNYF